MRDEEVRNGDVCPGSWKLLEHKIPNGWSGLGLEKQRAQMVTNLTGPFSSMNFVLDEQLDFKRRTA